MFLTSSSSGSLLWVDGRCDSVCHVCLITLFRTIIIPDLECECFVNILPVLWALHVQHVLHGLLSYHLYDTQL